MSQVVRKKQQIEVIKFQASFRENMRINAINRDLFKRKFLII